MDPELLDACGDTPSFLCEQVFDWSDRNGDLAQTIDFLFAKPLRILFIVVLAWVIVRLTRRVIRRVTERVALEAESSTLRKVRERTPAILAPTGPVNLRASARARTIGIVLRSITSWIVWGIAGLMVLGEIGINLGPLIAGAGIAGIALGFGAQSLVKDFLSGLFMLLEDQFGVGDIIDVGEASGVVEAVTLRSTRLRDVEGTVWHIPNGEIRRVGNKSQQWARALIDVQVAYDTDIRHAQEVIKRVADEMYGEEAWASVVLEAPEVWGIEMLGADGIDIRLVVKTKPSEQFRVMRELRIRLKEAFDAEGIEIPFPQRTLWLKQEPELTDDDPGGKQQE